MSFSVNILPQAEQDVAQILNYLFERSPDGAHHWWDAFQQAVDGLVRDPEAYGLAPETGLLGYQIRQFLFKTRRGRNYRGVFTIVDGTVYVLRIRAPGLPPLHSGDVRSVC